MAFVVSSVAAETEPLRQEAAHLEQEVQRLLADPAVERVCRAAFWGRFMELLKHRGEILRKVLKLFEASESVRQAQADQKWRHDAYGRAAARRFLEQVSRRERSRGRPTHRRCERRLGILRKQRNRTQ